jgi:hypothetical protein
MSMSPLPSLSIALNRSESLLPDRVSQLVDRRLSCGAMSERTSGYTAAIDCLAPDGAPLDAADGELYRFALFAHSFRCLIQLQARLHNRDRALEQQPNHGTS